MLLCHCSFTEQCSFEFSVIDHVIEWLYKKLMEQERMVNGDRGRGIVGVEIEGAEE